MDSARERPAVPPMDSGGDERVGGFVTGGVLVAIGWGLGIVANVTVHLMAPTGGLAFFGLRVFPHLGPFAWITFGIGLATGALGAGIAWVARESPPGPVVLPGYPYDAAIPDPSGATAATAGP
jgi:hypothetical protein